MSTASISVKKPGYFTQGELGPASNEFYRENGFLVVVDAVAPEEVDAMLGETVAICRGERGEVFLEQPKTSAGEPAAAQAEADLSDEAVIRSFLCIHQPHKISEVMHRNLGQTAIREVLAGVIGPNVKCMQSMLFIKAAGKPGQAWHQDEDYIPTRDRSLAGAWIALDDATVENGCLWVIPGSHEPGILWPQYPHNDPRFDCAEEAYDFPYADEDAIPVEVPRGSIVFFNGYTLHRSLPNKAESGFRRVLVNHYMSAESYLPWHHEQGRAMARQDYRDIVMIAGTDPYAWKGTRDIAKPHVRRDGQGGCGDGRLDLRTFKSTIGKANHKSG
ncbi:MAG: phytanoyl-CoA dioxygenase family protein [Opitutales bacterium]